MNEQPENIFEHVRKATIEKGSYDERAWTTGLYLRDEDGGFSSKVEDW